MDTVTYTIPLTSATHFDTIIIGPEPGSAILRRFRYCYDLIRPVTHLREQCDDSALLVLGVGL
jgi:hypothetical protein